MKIPLKKEYKIDSDVLDQNEAETVGGVSRYVSTFKSNKEIVNEQKEKGSLAEKMLPLPTTWSPETEKEVLLHFYQRYGDGSLEDFKEISGRIASNLMRTFNSTVSANTILEKLKQFVTKEELAGKVFFKSKSNSGVSSQTQPTNQPTPQTKIEISEKKYDFIKNLPPLTQEEKELAYFIEKDICFSTDGISIHLSIKPGKKPLEQLFNFSESEKMMFEIFKNQINDEFKAKKLVLLTRNIEKGKKHG